MNGSFRNRKQAGQLLADATRRLAGLDGLLVIGLPRGGVPIAVEVARELGADLDVVIVRKLGVPGREELAFGAIASNGAMVLNESVVRGLGLQEDTIQRVASRERAEIERRVQAWRPTHPSIEVRGRPVIVVDDGLATGATMRAAVQMLRQQGAARVIVAVPVAPIDTARSLQQEADEVICLQTPADFFGVGQFYDDFHQLSDDDVITLLDEDAKRRAQDKPGHANNGAPCHHSRSDPRDSQRDESSVTSRVPGTRWEAWARSFTAQHRGWRVHAHTDSGIRATGYLEAVIYPGSDGRWEVEITEADGTRQLVVAHPTAVTVLETRDGSHAGFTIHGADDRLDLRFRVPAHPSQLDGVTPSEMPPAGVGSHDARPNGRPQ